MIKFAKPSPLRALVCFTLVAASTCVVAGIALYTASIVAHNDPNPTPTGEYVRLFVVDITMWGPILLLTVWQISLPIILAVGLLVASVHVVGPPDDAPGTDADTNGRAPECKFDG